MAFDSISDFLAMDGYAHFVWPVCFIAVFALVILYVTAKKKTKRLFNDVIKEQSRQQRIKAAEELSETL